MTVFTKKPKRSIQNLRDDAEYCKLESHMLDLLADERLAERTARTTNTADACTALAKTREALKAAQAAVRERRRVVAQQIAKSALPEFSKIVEDLRQHLIDANDQAILLRDLQAGWESDGVCALSEPSGQRIQDTVNELLGDVQASTVYVRNMGFK